MQIFSQGVHSIMQNNSNTQLILIDFTWMAVNISPTVPQSPSTSDSFLWLPLSPPCLWPWVRLETVHQPSSLHHPSCCQSLLLKINSEKHVISLTSLALYGFVWHSKSSTIWIYCGFPAYLFLKNYFNPNLLQKFFPDPLNVFPPLPQASLCFHTSAS